MMQTHPHPPPKSKPKLKLLSGSGTSEMSFESQLGQRVGMVTLNNFLWSTFKTNMTESGSGWDHLSIAREREDFLNT
jgi:hypothetical protein